MKKIISAILLAAISGGTWADWILLGVNDTGNMSIHVNPDTIRNTNAGVKMWSLLDFKNPMLLTKAAPYLSMKLQTEFDCETDKTRTLSASFHSANQGGGETVETSNTVDPWESVPPESTIEAVWKFACGKR